MRELYHFGSPPTNVELFEHAKLFIDAAIKQDAASKIMEVANAILIDLLLTVNGRGKGVYPVSQQYENIKKQATVIGGILELLDPSPEIGKLSTLHPVPFQNIHPMRTRCQNPL